MVHLLFIILFQPSPPASVSGPESDAVIGDARAAIERGRPGAAVRLLREAIAKHPKDPDLREWLGRALQAEGDAEEAVKALRAALDLGAGNRPAIEMMLAVAHLDLRDPGGAIPHLKAASRAFPGDRRIRVLMGRARMETGDVRGGEEVLRAVLEEDPGDPEAAMSIAQLEYGRGRFAESIALFTVAGGTDRPNYYTLLHLAWAHLALNQLEEAQEVLERVSRIARTAEVEETFGRLLVRRQRPGEAAERFRSAIRERPDFAEAHFGLGSALRASGDTKGSARAMALFRRIHAKVQADINRAYALSQRIDRDPENAELLEEMAAIRERSGDLLEAERFLRASLARYPDRTGARTRLAGVYRRMGRYRDAYREYRKVLDRTPDDQEVRRAMERLVREHARPAGS